MNNDIFVNTKNTDRVVQSVKNAVKNNQWLIVVGEVGAGKTFLLKNLYETYKMHESKFHVIDFGKIMEGASLSISGVFGFLFESLRPGERIPQNVSKRYKLLKESLLDKIKYSKKKVILFFDESQALNPSLMRDLKKLHELSESEHEHLFSIVMFAKTDDRFNKLLDHPEIGWRVVRNRLNNLDKNEILDFAKTKFGLSFSSDRVKQLFLSNVQSYSPLGVKRTVDVIKAMFPDFNGKVNEEILNGSLNKQVKYLLGRHKVSLTQVVDLYKEKFGRNISKSHVSNFVNGDLDSVSAKTKEELSAVVSEIFSSVGDSDSAEYLQRVVNE